MNTPKDLISDQDFTIEMKYNPIDPQSDSPGDSEADAGEEFLMGMSYMPEDDDKYLKAKPRKKDSRLEGSISDRANLVSSDQPSPWLDLDENSNTH